ncbi:4-alpha-glucanotransferase [Blautia sp. An46]|uniref:4-alpha-glucanotransferase n=1 Tax=Blautia sp. An46 TaxID=1965636 RepID=UPI000B367F21|nr:4-alpha-glucanotransferase [Blautia sp. An46]OUN93018.1 4-alpha-glucanotransferase [Blautia sp. An46]
MRESGVLLPVASLPSNYGIGCFSREAYEFVDQLKAGGQKNWQILPLGPTGYGDSPYQSFSTFAGNPYFIDLETLIEEGLLAKQECDACDFGDNAEFIDYEKIYFSRFKILRKAFERFAPGEDFERFTEENKEWLEDYALYMGIKNSLGGISWSEWPDGLKRRVPEILEEKREELKDEIQFIRFQQYEFAKQWTKLKKYANDQGIRIIGDIPIYVAFDSADAWANPELFQFDEECTPTAVAGCPPDAFAATGQLWGNPLYDWEYHEKTGFAWWIQRLEYCYKLYDVVRVDHFRGFDEYYAIPYGDKTAEFGEWKKGPGLKLFKAVKEAMGDTAIIAEDLGYLTDSVRQLVKDTGYPGMKVLQFAFDSREESDYLPHNYDHNCVVYTGTHDNNTILGWLDEMAPEDRLLAERYLNNRYTRKEDMPWDFIRLSMASVADLAITPIQEFLCLGGEARINRPSTLGINWKWRLLKGQITHEITGRMYDMTKLYGRL